MADAEDTPFAEWVIVELMGHRRLAGHIQEEQLAGAGFLRLDIPATPGHGPETQYIAPASVYALHPTTEAIATAAAANFRPQPVSRWELEQSKTIDQDDPTTTLTSGGDADDFDPWEDTDA